MIGCVVSQIESWQKIFPNKLCLGDCLGDEVGRLLIVARATIDVDEWVVRGLLLQVIVEFGFKLISMLLIEIYGDDLRNGHAADPMSEDGVGQ